MLSYYLTTIRNNDPTTPPLTFEEHSAMNNDRQPHPLEQFFNWAVPIQNAQEPRSQYQSSGSTGSSNSGSYGQRGRGFSGPAGYGRPYGPSPSYDYHRRSPPHHQGSHNGYARGAGYHQRPYHRGGGYRGGGHRGHRGNGHRYETYPRDHDRREEERLRARALQRRIKTPPPAAPWVRSLFPPDIAAADEDGNGHPICPLEIGTGDNESDYGSDSDIPSLPAGWRTTELARQADAAAHEQLGTREYTRHVVPASDAIGHWAGKTIETKDEAANVLRWIARTEPTAFHFMHCERVRLGSDPTITRSEGQVYLLQRQNGAAEQFWLATTNRRKGPSRYEPPVAYKTEAAQRADEDMYAYLGTALLGEDTTFVYITELAEETSEVRSGSHTKLLDADRLYANIEFRLWPIGFRINEREYPDPRGRFAKPYQGDVLAWYTINALAPRRTRVGTSIERAKFMELLIRILSIAGTYNRIANSGEYVAANRPLQHYPFLTMNATFSHVVAWLIQHGIRRDGDAIKVLESFARSRRNAKEDRETPNAVVFTKGGLPHDMDEMVAMKMGTDFCHWKDVMHAGLQPGVTSDYPQQPSSAMEE
ncbi:hypothetical protein DFH06DRAFT_1346171 [Mycena polygramma]|nr:hypothetical protein DFH06DRAFT_1346171 [Mycena polygramma]